MASPKRTLITAAEVIKHGPEGSGLPAQLIEKHISRVEVSFARNWLGYDFYLALIEDSYDVELVEDYNSATTYALDDIVLCYGKLYKSLKAGNTDKLSVTASWSEISKMKTEAYEELYDLYLRSYLAYSITADVVEFAQPVGPKGLVDISEDGISTSSIDRISKRKRITKEMADEILDNTAYWIFEQKYSNKSSAFDDTLIISRSQKVINPNPKARRFALKTLPVVASEDYIKTQLLGRSYVMITPRQYYENAQSNVLTWEKNQGDLYSLLSKGTVSVYQNGNKLVWLRDFQVNKVENGNDTVTIDANVHFAGSNYEIVAIAKI